MELPQIGLGTWELRGKEGAHVVKLALEAGYKHIDTAHMYENHKAIRTALEGYDRTRLFITSKIAIGSQVQPQKVEASVEQACDLALKELGTDYLDLYLIHSPDRGFPLERIFEAMQTLTLKKKIGKAGVSNFHVHHLEALRKAGFTPFANQVEFHPYLYQKELLDYCKKHGIVLIAYRPFGKGKLLEAEPLFDKIGIKHNKTGSQVILRWLIQRGIPVVPKASSELHLRQNLDIFNFTLTEEEMSQLDHLSRGKRYCPEYG